MPAFLLPDVISLHLLLPNQKGKYLGPLGPVETNRFFFLLICLNMEWELATQYSCLENFMDRGAWQATVHRVIELDTTV